MMLWVRVLERRRFNLYKMNVIIKNYVCFLEETSEEDEEDEEQQDFPEAVAQDADAAAEGD